MVNFFNAVISLRCSHVGESSVDQNIEKLDCQTPNKSPLEEIHHE